MLVFFVFLLYFLSFIKPKNGVIGHFHVQTFCSDGRNSYEDFVEEALRLRLDFIVLADHRVCKEYFEKCMNEKRITCIPSELVSTSKGYVLAFNIKKPIAEEYYYTGSVTPAVRKGDEDFWVNLSMEEIIERIHEQNALAIADYNFFREFKSYWENRSEEFKKLGFDAIFCHGSYEDILTCEKISKELNLPCVYSSVAHEKSQIKEMLSLCESKNLTKAVVEGKCKPLIPLFVRIQKILVKNFLAIT